MPTAKKLPSGSWRVRVFSHYEYIDDKKKARYESFTCDDPSKAGKKEAERMAAEWLYERQQRLANVTIGDAIEQYIRSKAGVLSPSTLTAYKSYQKNHYDEIAWMPIRNLDMVTLQAWLSSKTNTPKTVRNVYGLLNSAVKVYSHRDLELTLPAPKKPELHTPTDKELKKLMDHIKGKDLEIAVVLAAFCSLRRGEICALEASDLDGDVLTISKSMVETPDGGYEIKQPKTFSSYRTVIVPESVITFFQGKEGRVFSMTPKILSNRFRRAVDYTMKHCDTEYFRFHDLRHYYASIAHALGVPDAYIMKTGGWKTDNVMKRVYREAMPDKLRTESQKVLNYIEKIG